MLLPIQYIWSCTICWSVSSIGEMQPRKVISGIWVRAVCCEWWQVHGHVCRTRGCWHYPEWTPISSQTSKDFAVLPERVQEHLPGPVVMIFLELLLRPVFMSLTNPPCTRYSELGVVLLQLHILHYSHSHLSLVAQASLGVKFLVDNVCTSGCLFSFNIDIIGAWWLE